MAPDTKGRVVFLSFILIVSTGSFKSTDNVCSSLKEGLLPSTVLVRTLLIPLRMEA